MIYAVFYCFFLFLMLLVSLMLKKKTTFYYGQLPIFVYFLVSFLSILIIKNDLMPIPKVTFFPYLLLIFSNFLILYPFMIPKKSYIEKDLKTNKIFKYFSIIYILFSFVTIYILFGDAIQLLSIGNWRDNIVNGYLGNNAIQFGNIFQWISINFVNYFRLLATVVFFYTFDNNNKKKNYVRWVLLICIFLTLALVAIYNSSRGLIFNFMLLFVTMMLFFVRDLNKKSVNKIKFVMVITGIAFIWYAIKVTIDRFGIPGNLFQSTIDSISFYFGHSPIVFNYGVTTISSLSYGRFSFGSLFELFGYSNSFNQINVGGSWGMLFYTYAGPIFIDFGPIGVILFSIMLFAIIKHFLKKRFTLSNIYVVFIILSYILQGAFVIGRNYIIELTANIIIYIALRLFERLNLKRNFKITKIT